MMVSCRVICLTALVILTPPRSPAEVGISAGMMMMGAEGAINQEQKPRRDVYPPGPAFKEWRLNTNFGNVGNWEGLRGHENCSRNIYSFPAWYDEEFVVTWPKVFTGKQIILPVNAHFVFGGGNHTFLNAVGGGSGGGQEDTCEGREVEFLRRSTADWYDPDNWVHHHRDNLKDGGDDDHWDNAASLLNAEMLTGDYAPTSITAIPHVERVPCQYDSALFRGNSSFNLKISLNATVARFYLGDKKMAHSELMTVMNSPLGKLQFQVAPETVFTIRDEGCTVKDGDSDRCICSNYGDRNVRQKICAIAKCSDEEENCPNPITPHGFCCSICGFHVKLRHSGNLKLNPIYTKLQDEVARSELQGMIHAYLTRYKEKAAHIVIFPKPKHLRDVAIRKKLFGLVGRLESILKQESEVIGVTLTESWGRADGDGGSIDRLEGSGLGGGLITLIVFLVLSLILAGIALFIFMWNRKHGYPPLTLSSMTSALPRMSSMRIPIVPGGGGGGGVGAGRRSSTISNTLHSFGFARFTNERMSTVTISPGETSEGGSSGGGGEKPAKSSSFRRTDKVDDEPLPLPEEVEKVTDANSGAFGFTNVSYDLVAGVEGEAKNVVGEKVKEEESSGEKVNHPILTIPEVTVVEMAEETSTIQLKAKTPASRPPAPLPETSSSKEEKSTGKVGKPGFVASRFAKAYQKLGPGIEEADKDKKANEPKKGKKKGKKAAGTFKATRLEEDDESDVDDPVRVKEEATKAEAAGPTPISGDEPLIEPLPEISSPPPQQQKEAVVEGELVNLEE